MVWVARFILRGRGPALAVFAVLPPNYEPSNLVCSAEILGRSTKGTCKNSGHNRWSWLILRCSGAARPRWEPQNIHADDDSRFALKSQAITFLFRHEAGGSNAWCRKAPTRGAQGCPGKLQGDSFERLPPNFAAKSLLPGLGPGIHVLTRPKFPQRRRGWPGQARPWGCSLIAQDGRPPLLSSASGLRS
jgi:hypothetical protein